jgi:hypothetical protein
MMVDPSHVGINGGSDDQCSVKVAVRVRPLTAKEQLQNCNDCVSYVPGRPEVVLDSTRGQHRHKYGFSFSSMATNIINGRERLKFMINPFFP